MGFGIKPLCRRIRMRVYRFQSDVLKSIQAGLSGFNLQ